ncbi:hypothetical protein K432DRAFT_264578, partial [Lepidopterella palustris CBS 459.81]
LLQSLHSSGLIWAYAIPASAFIVRCLFIFIPFALPTRLAAQRYAALNPIRQALTVARRQKARELRSSPKAAFAFVARQTSRDASQLHSRWHCSLPRRVLLPFCQIPVFLIMAETIRKMLGTQEGLLSMAVSAFRTTFDYKSAAVVVANSDGMNHPSLATGGMLWFPNLMVPDPTCSLPFILSGLMFYNIWQGRQKGAILSPPARYLRGFLLFVAAAIGPLTLQVPAGLLLYWASSTTSAMILNKVLDLIWPIEVPPMACKRPL